MTSLHSVLRPAGRGLVAVLIVAGFAAPSFAQTRPAPKPAPASPGAAQKPPEPQKPSPARPAVQGPPMFSLQGFGHGGLTGFTAKSSFDALFGSSSGATYGGGAQVAHRSGLFVRFDLSRFQATGERAFVHNGELFQLGIPLKLTLTPIEFTAGYRFVARQRAPRRPTPPRPAPAPRKSVSFSEQSRPVAPVAQAAARPQRLRQWVPYIGGGIGKMEYEESSSLAGTGETESTSFSSYHVLGGVDVPVWKFIGLGVEGHYRWVPDALGENGVSKEYGETDLGGYAFRLRLIIGR